MYIAALVGSIAAFVCALTPLFGIPFTLVFSITAIVFAILGIRKSDGKEEKDASIISLIISIIAIIICVIVNVVSINFIIDVIDYFKDEVNIDDYYEQKFEEYTEYNTNDEILLGTDFILTINDFSSDGNIYYVDVTVEALNDDSYISIYDFGIYSANENDFVYSSYYSSSNYTSDFLDEGDTKDIILKFEGEFEDDSQLYLMYIDNENGVKINL